ncbi:hypothetical protein FOXYSP1_05449 [Fusarium oxysporum f. sp. phaseoli]
MRTDPKSCTYGPTRRSHLQVVTIAPPDPDNQLSLPRFAPSIERAQRLVGSGPYPQFDSQGRPSQLLGFNFLDARFIRPPR